MKCDICKKELNKNTKMTYKNNILCPKHYQQFLKFGHALDSIQRTTHDLNDFEINGNDVIIHCYNKQAQKTASFIIDLKDLDFVIAKKWRYWKGRIYTGNFKIISIAQYLMGVKEGMVIDHIDSNPLNNRRSNLRFVTQQKNVVNQSLKKNNKSGYKGVRWDNTRNKFTVEIKYKYKKCHLGRYDKIEDAVFARYYGECLLFKNYRNKTQDNKIIPFINKCKNKDTISQYIRKRILSTYDIDSR